MQAKSNVGRIQCGKNAMHNKANFKNKAIDCVHKNNTFLSSAKLQHCPSLIVNLQHCLSLIIIDHIVIWLSSQRVTVSFGAPLSFAFGLRRPLIFGLHHPLHLDCVILCLFCVFSFAFLSCCLCLFVVLSLQVKVIQNGKLGRDVPSMNKTMNLLYNRDRLDEYTHEF